MTPETPEFLYQSFFDNTLDGLAYCQMIFDHHRNPVDFLYLKINKNFEALTGLKDVVGKKVTEIMPGITKSNPELFEIYGRVALTGESQKFETFIEPLARWFFVSVYRPKKEFFVAVFQNITDRKQIEENLENARIAARNVLEDLQAEKAWLAEAKAKDEAMLASIGDGVVIVDPVGKIKFMNRSAQNSLGWNSSQIAGKLVFDVVPVEDEGGDPVPANLRPMALALVTGTPMIGEGREGAAKSTRPAEFYYYVRKDKTRFPVAITVAPVLLGNKIVGAIEVFRDITREKEIDKAKTEFVSLASHQLRTPLSTVTWYAEMLLAGDAGALNPAQKKYLDEVYKGSRRMVVLVNALLNVSRLELGTFVVDPALTDVIELIRSVINEQKPQIDERSIRLLTAFEKDIPKIHTDPKLLSMIVQNLLSNSVKYTPANGTVKLRLRLVRRGGAVGNRPAPEDSLAIILSDTGYGIPKHQQDKIFTKLFRADNVREKDTEGTGLGLYIVKSIIDHSGGRIWFESPTRVETAAGGKDNLGTTFYVTLPLTGMKKKDGANVLA